MAAVVLISMAVIAYLHFPIENFYFDDENFVLPERVWFDGSLNWLGHLLFFNQTRFTWVGDFFLVRPLLFFWMWVQDAFFRPDRSVVQALCLGVNFLVFASAFQFLRRWTGPLIAASAALYAVTCLIGRQFYTWPHANGYPLAIAFFTLALTLMLNEKLNRKRAFLAGFLFLASCLAYELAAITLPLLLIFEYARPANKKERNRRWSAQLVPLLVFAGVVVFAQIALRPRGISSVSELKPIDNAAMASFWVWAIFLRNLFLVSLPFPAAEITFATVKCVIMAGLILTVGVKGWRRLSPGARRATQTMALPILALFIGLWLGRVGPRAVIKEHYFSLFHYLLTLTIVIPVSGWIGRSVKRERLIALVLVASSVWVSLWTSWLKAEGVRENEVALKTVADIQRNLRESGGCFAGLADPFGRMALSSTVNSALLQYSCARNEGAPVFFKTYEAGGADRFTPTEWPLPEPTGDWLGKLDLGHGTNELADFLLNSPRNLPQAQAGELSGGAEVRTSFDETLFHRFHVDFRSEDQWPEMWNSGVVFQSAEQKIYLLLRNNMLDVLVKEASAPRALASVPLFSVQGPIHFDLVQAEAPFCRVYINGALIVQVPICRGDLSNPGLIRFDNGTPPEIPERASVQ